MKKFITSNTFLYTAGLVFVFLLWLLISLSQGQGNLIFPSPMDTFRVTGELLSQGYIYQCLGMTLLRTLEGFGVSFLLALLVGSLAGEIPYLQRFFKPLILVFKAAPTAAFVFLFLMMSGTSKAPVWIVGLLAFPILYESVVAGYNAVPLELVQAAQVDGGGAITNLFRIKLPLSIPYIILGILSSFALSFKTAIMAEIVAGMTSPGLGGAIRMFRNEDPSDLTPVFAVALIAIVAVLFFDLISYGVKKALTRSFGV